MNWIIRRMTAGDIQAVQKLEQQIPEAPHWTLSDYERCIGMNSSESLQRAGFIAETEGQLLGFSVGKLVTEIGELESIAVASEARGQGIGQALLQAVADWAQTTGAVRIELEVRASNVRAIKFYERSGFYRESLRPAYYQAPEEDAVLMGKPLKPVENFPEKRIASRPPEC
jgi:ribosomal-protein-alanine N-acetyltransferase